MPRSVWTGTISFGFVNVAVKAFRAVHDHGVHFHQLQKRTGSRIRNRKVSEKSGKEVDTDDIELGFEVSKGRYVTFDHDELEALRPSRRGDRHSDFVALDEIDPIYYEQTYWLAPDGDAAEGLPAAAGGDGGADVSAIGTVVMRTSSTSPPSARSTARWPCRRCASPTRS